MNTNTEEFYELLFDDFFKVKEKENSKQYNTKGGNKQRFVIVYKSMREGNESSQKAELDFLNTVIKSGLKMEEDDVLLLDLSYNEGCSLSEIILTFKPLKMLVWGCDDLMKREGWDMNNNQVANVRSTMLLKASVLSDYLDNQKLKLALWNSGIKQMF